MHPEPHTKAKFFHAKILSKTKEEQMKNLDTNFTFSNRPETFKELLNKRRWVGDVYDKLTKIYRIEVIIMNESFRGLPGQEAPSKDCADTSIIQTRSRQELLYMRSQIDVAAKAFQLEAIDMVGIHYKDLDYLKDECEDGRRLGFTGKVS
ncbi:hypothetical protein E1B28_005088 [Marasmius oreades]|uniref:Uncharacterized protein n=1 Tax=Marasmius oreades TaxID=181124 RepID=A0A9P8ADR9_9AGAR|nr:uncharacterized protein E1B28_005088 [Marasmius oreades]KAG7097768.1 hypothetical protein E1B28_005088 [Marasmius oreades]